MAKRILVYGGSFDPPHKGHLKLLKAAVGSVRPDEIHIVPAFHAPLKDGHAVNAETRLELARHAFGPGPVGPAPCVNDIEIASGRKIYTWQTLERFRRANPAAQLFFLIGSDCLLDFSRWQRPDRVLELAVVLAGSRPGSPIPMDSPFTVLPGEFPDLASSALRAEMFAFGRIPASVAPGAAGYIRGNGLYYLNIHKWLAKNVSPARYEHICQTTGLAIELAVVHGANSNTAAMAALLHDCAKGIPTPDLARYCRRHRLRVPMFDEISALHPGLLHAYAGAHMAQQRFGVRNKAVLNAIRYHTTGRARMPLLEKIIYVADSCGRDRRYPMADRIRQTALAGSLDDALFAAVRAKLSYVVQTCRWLYPKGLELWNSLTARNPA
ncbi:MAG: bis(5'-nucleosyl)-tetraphosphatase (symmetrical) YqeK [Elusimicrobiaceae bacterium]|nr:bis(5'-nucleosyl)-tetraphosphatase (symmetrical) YqeK [Elusimicrobiaceae bacterium]